MRITLFKSRKKKRYFLVQIFLYRNFTMRKVFTDLVETSEGEFPSAAVMKFQAVVAHKQSGFDCTHAEIGIIQEIKGQDAIDFEFVPQDLLELAQKGKEEYLVESAKESKVKGIKRKFHKDSNVNRKRK